MSLVGGDRERTERSDGSGVIRGPSYSTCVAGRSGELDSGEARLGPEQCRWLAETANEPSVLTARVSFEGPATARALRADRANSTAARRGWALRNVVGWRRPRTNRAF